MVAGLEQRLKSQIVIDAEGELPEFLERREGWTGIILHTSLKVRRVYRAWRDGFLFLHELQKDPANPSKFHTHPGKMWVAQKAGLYRMDVAYDQEKAPKEGEYETKIINADDKYYLGANDWHRIQPLTPQTRSVVVVQDWHPPAISNIKVDQMTSRELQQHLEQFKVYQYI